jgi:hypothetical protein
MTAVSLLLQLPVDAMMRISPLPLLTQPKIWLDCALDGPVKAKPTSKAKTNFLILTSPVENGAGGRLRNDLAPG